MTGGIGTIQMEDSREKCLFHSQQSQLIFQDALKVLKGKVIPKNIVKRSGYLVCDCKKKHTPLDAVLNKEDFPKVHDALLNSLKKQDQIQKQNAKDVDSKCQAEQTSDPTHSNVDVSSKETETNADLETLNLEEKDTDETNNSNETDNRGHQVLENKLIQRILSNQDLSTGEHRLLGIIWLCLHGNTKQLLPRDLHTNRVEEIRKLNRKPYFKHKKLKKTKYEYVEDIVINQPSVSMRFKSSTVTVPEFVGKRGKNINEITKDRDCLVMVDKSGDKHAIKITIHARSASERDQIRHLVHNNYRLIKNMKTDWQKKKEDNDLFHEHIAQQPMKAGKNSGVSCWDFYNEQKESARDEFEKKHAYQSNHKREMRNKKSEDTDCHKKVPVLERGSRCINCLINHEEKSSSTSCRYHPGYVGGNGKWTCCKKKPKAKYIGNDGVDIQKLSHSYNGCTQGKHNWRPHRSRKSSGRDGHKDGHI